MNWPTREEAIRLTAIVIGISAGLSLFLGLFDFIFTDAVKNIVLRGAPQGTALEEAANFDPGSVDVVTDEGAPANIEIEPIAPTETE